MDENLMEHGGVLVSCVISVAIIVIMSAVIFAISIICRHLSFCGILCAVFYTYNITNSTAMQ